MKNYNRTGCCESQQRTAGRVGSYTEFTRRSGCYSFLMALNQKLEQIAGIMTVCRDSEEAYTRSWQVIGSVRKE